MVAKYELALTEFNHPEILGVLGTEDWTNTGIM